MIDMAPPRDEKRRKVPRGQTIVHILTLLYLAYKLIRKVNEEVDELYELKPKKS